MEGHEAQEALFSLFGLEVTSRVTTMWGLMALIIIASFIATRSLRRVPGGWQNFMEWAVESLLNFFAGTLGEEKAKRYLPFLATMFLFILTSNYSGLLPMSGKLPGFTAPTSALGVTLGWALIVFVVTQLVGIWELGGRYFKKFVQPMFFLLPLNLIEQFVRPLSLSLRLYGNIFGEEMVVAQLMLLMPMVVPALMQVLGFLFGLIQAVVFTMLAAIYISEATSEEH